MDINAMLANIPFVPYIAFYASGVAGVIGHWAHKFGKGDVKDNLFQYLFTSYPKRTLATLSALVTAEAAAFATGALPPAVSGTLVAAGFIAGHSADSAFNKGGVA